MTATKPKADWEKSSQERYDPERKMPPREDPHEIISELLREKGISRYVEIEGDWEGDILPGGTPNESGNILTEDGKVYTYWLGWDPEKIAPDGIKGWYTLGESFKDPVTGEPHPLFREVTPEEFQEMYKHPLEKDPDYLRAKKELGLR